MEAATASDLVVDPVFGARYRFARDTDDRGARIQRVEMWVDAGGGVPAHVHPTVTERFEVLDGHLEVLGGRTWKSYGPGESADAPAGMRHAFRNRGAVEAHAVAEASPPSTLQAFLEEAAGLARDGALSKFQGLPTSPTALLKAAVLAHTHRDMVELGFPLPPPFIQRLIFPPLARLGERRGYRSADFAQL